MRQHHTHIMLCRTKHQAKTVPLLLFSTTVRQGQSAAKMSMETCTPGPLSDMRMYPPSACLTLGVRERIQGTQGGHQCMPGTTCRYTAQRFACCNVCACGGLCLEAVLCVC
jgi:hypothetical protein